MRPHSGWQVAGRGTLAVLAVLTTFTVGWLVAEIVFRFTGHPPALVGYLIAVVLSLAIGVACASLYARVTGRDDRNLLEEIRIALESASPKAISTSTSTAGSRIPSVRSSRASTRWPTTWARWNSNGRTSSPTSPTRSSHR